jgi:CheY-like chemotaxis protein
MNILYLENHSVFAEQVRRQFLAAHWVTIVPGLAEARTAFATGICDLVVCDYDLDDGKGDEFVRECRLTHPQLPAIAASSHEAGNAALLKAGASTVCRKMEIDGIQEVIAILTGQFPNDANGDVLRRKYRNGDDLFQPRMLEFRSIFPERHQALAFAELADNRDFTVPISYNLRRQMWQAMVSRFMIPTHQAISTLEFTLTDQAESVGGEADGWGSFNVKSKA